MIKLVKVNIHKYKCIETAQEFDVDDSITVLVGMNESGKTSVLEAVAKTNYFQSDSKFKFNATHDYPRKDKKKMDKSGTNPVAIDCTYKLSEELLSSINSEFGGSLFNTRLMTISSKYCGSKAIGNVAVDIQEFWNLVAARDSINDGLKKLLTKISTESELNTLASELEGEAEQEIVTNLKKYFVNENNWNDSVGEYIYRELIKPHLPKFLYYDEYYSLPSRISIEKLQNETLDSDELKTAKALFELADIDIKELISSDEFENFKAELEATQVNISEELFQFWRTNKDLDIQFDIDKKVKDADKSNNTHVVEHILDIRVRNNRTKVSLPLKNRSKGFNWFFSFLVWFKKIQEDRASNYIILLDEPGLNLHASAQSDLLKFIDHLSKDYQIMYSTHSPFMIEASSLHRVRTIVETNEGSVISDSVQEKDPNALFPLQVALGYDIAQNLFISDKNLLVEGVSDLIYLEVMSNIVRDAGHAHLDESIAIVPVGGLEKVSTFVSLLRGNKLKIACLLDSNIDPSSKSRLERLIAQKIIQQQKIRFFDEFIDGYSSADIEDLFEKNEYLRFFNKAFGEHPDIEASELNSNIKQIILQINKNLRIQRFNHYRPANELAKSSPTKDDFSSSTLKRFGELFSTVNKLL